MPAHLKEIAALALLAVTAAGCGGSGGGAAEPAAKPAAEESSASATPGEEAASECPSGATCYDFSDQTADWPKVNEQGYFAAQDAYGGGSFRLGARANGLYNVTSPARASAVAQDYGIDVSAAATLGPQFSPSGAVGLSCWTRRLENGATAGFVLLVRQQDVVLGILSQEGRFTPIDKGAGVAAVAPARTLEIGLSCRQDTSSGNAEAAIVGTVDGQEVVSVSYGNGASNVGWEAADGIGVLVAGKDADAFFDDVVIAPAGS